MQLVARIFNLQDEHLATIHQHEGIEVTWPLNDSRLATVTVSIYDQALQHVRPLDRLLTVEYGPHLLFKGYILKPTWNAAARTVQIDAHDATLKLKQHYHRYGDEVVDDGFPQDGTGFRMLMASSFPIPEQIARGVPGHGILDATDTVPPVGPKPTDPDDPDAAKWGQIDRGRNVWDSLVTLTQSSTGFDFDFDPIDEAHPPIGGTHSPGYLAQLHTRPRVGQDLTDTVVFHYGFGADNAEDFTYEPDGDVVRNYWVEVNPGGEKHPGDDKNKALVHDEGSWLRYGIYGGWESAGQHWPKPILVDRAKRWVSSYAYPPDFFTVDPKPDHPGVPLLMRDYTIGDVIKAAARVGQLDVELIGRIIEARVTQRSPSGGANVTLTCVPGYDTFPEEGDEGDPFPVEEGDIEVSHARRPDFLDRHMRTAQRVRDLEIAAHPETAGGAGGGGKFMDTHSFIVGGAVDPSLYIPPAQIYLPDPDEEGIADQHTSIYWSYGAYCRTGSVSVLMKLIRGGVETTISDTTELRYNDRIRAQITGGSGQDLTAWYVLIHSF